MEEQSRPQQKEESLRPGTEAFKKRANRHASLIPYDTIQQLKAPIGFAGQRVAPVTIEVTQEIAVALARAVEYNAHEAHVHEESNRFHLARVDRMELVLQIYRAYVENLSDDHIEDMSWQDIQDSAKHLLGIMY
jgi:hypothetical protein